MKFSRKISQRGEISVCDRDFFPEQEGRKFLFSLQRPFTVRMEVYDGERSAAAAPRLLPN